MKALLVSISVDATEAPVHVHANPFVKTSAWLPVESPRLTQELGLAACSHLRLISHDKRAIIITRKQTVEKLKENYASFGKASDD